MLTAREVASIFARWSIVPLPSSPCWFPAKVNGISRHMRSRNHGSAPACRSPSRRREHHFRDRCRSATAPPPARGRASGDLHSFQSRRRARAALDAFEPRRQFELEADPPALSLQQPHAAPCGGSRKTHRGELLRRRYCSEHLNVNVTAGPPRAHEWSVHLETAIRGYGMDRWSFKHRCLLHVS